MTVTSMGMTTSSAPPSVVVGVDGGLLQMRVLDRAVAEARRRDHTLRIVHVHGPAASGPAWYDDAGDRAEHYVRRTAPDVVVRRMCPSGDPATALASACRASSLLVLGDRHRRLGSEAGRVTEELIDTAPCPVLVIGEYRGPAPVRTPYRSVVVVGVDDGLGPDLVLRSALDVAELLDEPVEVVHAVGEVGYEARGIVRRTEDGDRATPIDARVTSVHGRVPAVPVSMVVAEDRPARLLLERARGADLVVVGHRGHGGANLVGLGSTARALLLAAPCPVLVLGPRLSVGPATGPTGAASTHAGVSQ